MPESKPIRPSTGPSTRSGQGSGVRILCMEDDPGLARLIQKELERAGYLVDLAGDGEEGLAMYAAGAYDVVAVDHDMPIHDGLEVIRVLASQGALPPTIMVTGSGNEQIAVEAVKFGAHDYIVKDAEGRYLDLLPRVVERVLREQRLVEERRQALEALRESEARYRGLFDGVPVGLYRCTLQEQILDANPALMEMLGYADRTALLTVRLPELYMNAEERLLWQDMMERDGIVRGLEVRLRRRDGSVIWVRSSARAVHHADGRVLYYEGSLADITERKRAEETIRQLAYHDDLTGLPNRRLFDDRLNLEMAHAHRNRQELAVMLLDLDHFKDVNDTLGHSVGDQLLQAVGDRLKKLLRKSDTVARMGGDEFMLISPEIGGGEDAATIAQRILEAIREPFVVDGHELHITTSIGIALYPKDGEDGDTLMKKADIAMYCAKDRGRDNHQQYTPAMNANAQSSLASNQAGVSL